MNTETWIEALENAENRDAFEEALCNLMTLAESGDKHAITYLEDRSMPYEIS